MWIKHWYASAPYTARTACFGQDHENPPQGFCRQPVLGPVSVPATETNGVAAPEGVPKVRLGSQKCHVTKMRQKQQKELQRRAAEKAAKTAEVEAAKALLARKLPHLMRSFVGATANIYAYQGTIDPVGDLV